MRVEKEANGKPDTATEIEANFILETRVCGLFGMRHLRYTRQASAGMERRMPRP